MVFFMIMDQIAMAITGTVFNVISTWIRNNVYFHNIRIALLIGMDFVCTYLFVYAILTLISNRMANKKSDKKMVMDTKIRA